MSHKADSQKNIKASLNKLPQAMCKAGLQRSRGKETAVGIGKHIGSPCRYILCNGYSNAERVDVMKYQDKPGRVSGTAKKVIKWNKAVLQWIIQCRPSSKGKTNLNSSKKIKALPDTEKQ